MHRSALFFLVFSACNLSPQKDTGPAVTDDSGNPSGERMTIQEIREGQAVDGDVVTVSEVVVTSPVTRDTEGFFIQEQDGGPKSGLYVWYPTGMDPFVVAEGDKVTITGTISEYYGWTELAISDLADIEKTGTAAVPAPVELGDGAGVNWDDYESVLVKMDDQTVESVNSYNTGKLSGGINLDDGFVYLDYTCGGHFDSLTGIVFYQYEEHSLNPRSEADLGTYADGATSSSTISAVQQGTACGNVELTDIIATTDMVTEDDGSSSFFAQDAGGGEYSGIVVFFPAGTTETITAGTKLSVVGSATEYYDFTELYVGDATTLSVGGQGTPTAVSLTSAPADWEAYEGVLVTLENVQITADPDAYGQAMTSFNILVDDELFRYDDLTNGQSFGSITGVIAYSYSEWKIWPRSAGDMQ